MSSDFMFDQMESPKSRGLNGGKRIQEKSSRLTDVFQQSEDEVKYNSI